MKRLKQKKKLEKKAEQEAAAAKKRQQQQQQNVSPAKTGSKAEYQQYAHDLVINTYGWSEHDFQCLVNLWERESG